MTGGKKLYPPHPLESEPFWRTARREASRHWYFVAGFGIVFLAALRFSTTFTEEDVKKSKFANPKGHH